MIGILYREMYVIRSLAAFRSGLTFALTDYSNYHCPLKFLPYNKIKQLSTPYTSLLHRIEGISYTGGTKEHQ